MKDTFQGSNVTSIIQHIRAPTNPVLLVLLWRLPLASLFFATSPLSGPWSPVRMTKQDSSESRLRQADPAFRGSPLFLTHPAQGQKHNSPLFYRCRRSDCGVSPRGRTRACVGHTYAGGCGAQTLEGTGGSLLRPSLCGHLCGFHSMNVAPATGEASSLDRWRIGPGALGLQSAAPIPHTC